MKSLPAHETKIEWLWHMRQQHLKPENGPSWEQLAPLQTPRYKTMLELVQQSHYFYEDIEPNLHDLEAFRCEALENALNELVIDFSRISDWTAANISAAIKAILQVHSLKMPQIAQPIRLLVSATLTTPSIDATLELLGKEKVMARLKKYPL